MASTAVATRTAGAPPAPAGATANLPVVEPQVRRWGPITMGAAVVAAAEAMLFAGLLATWLVARSTSEGWLPEDVHVDIYRGSTLVGTALLAALAAQWAVSAARKGDGAHTIIASALSLGLAAAMADLLWFTMIKIDVGAGSSLYATLWFALLGTYLAVAVATAVGQIAVLVRAIGGRYRDIDHQPVTAIALQWWTLTSVFACMWLAIWVMR